MAAWISPLQGRRMARARFKHSLAYRPVALALAVACLCTAGVAAQETTLTILAATIRENGYACETPKQARPDPEHSSPEEKAWIVDCETGAYRVKYMGDRRPDVTPLHK